MYDHFRNLKIVKRLNFLSTKYVTDAFLDYIFGNNVYEYTHKHIYKRIIIIIIIIIQITMVIEG